MDPKQAFQLIRMRPFEGMALTAQDLGEEQLYHRRHLHRHSFYMHGHGVVQGLQVELDQRQGKYVAVIKAGYGLSRLGQGVLLPEAVVVPLEIPRQDGEYMLWLFHVEAPEDGSQRPVFDTNEKKEGRTREFAAARLHPIEEDYDDAVALTRINVRLGRMVQPDMPVPRAGRHAWAAESTLKKKVVEFIRLNKKVIDALYRTARLQELSLGTLGFYSSMISAEFMLIETGTADRVLFRTAGSLIQYAHDFYNPLPDTIERINRFREFVRRVHSIVPGPDQSDDIWLKWFESFDRLLQPLAKVVEELGETADTRRS